MPTTKFKGFKNVSKLFKKRNPYSSFDEYTTKLQELESSLLKDHSVEYVNEIIEPLRIKRNVQAQNLFDNLQDAFLKLEGNAKDKIDSLFKFYRDNIFTHHKQHVINLELDRYAIRKDQNNSHDLNIRSLISKIPSKALQFIKKFKGIKSKLAKLKHQNKTLEKENLAKSSENLNDMPSNKDVKNVQELTDEELKERYGPEEDTVKAMLEKLEGNESRLDKKESEHVNASASVPPQQNEDVEALFDAFIGDDTQYTPPQKPTNPKVVVQKPVTFKEVEDLFEFIDAASKMPVVENEQSLEQEQALDEKKKTQPKKRSQQKKEEIEPKIVDNNAANDMDLAKLDEILADVDKAKLQTAPTRPRETLADLLNTFSNWTIPKDPLEMYPTIEKIIQKVPEKLGLKKILPLIMSTYESIHVDNEDRLGDAVVKANLNKMHTAFKEIVSGVVQFESKKDYKIVADILNKMSTTQQVAIFNPDKKAEKKVLNQADITAIDEALDHLRELILNAEIQEKRTKISNNTDFQNRIAILVLGEMDDIVTKWGGGLKKQADQNYQADMARMEKLKSLFDKIIDSKGNQNIAIILQNAIKDNNESKFLNDTILYQMREISASARLQSLKEANNPAMKDSIAKIEGNIKKLENPLFNVASNKSGRNKILEQVEGELDKAFQQKNAQEIGPKQNAGKKSVNFAYRVSTNTDPKAPQPSENFKSNSPTVKKKL